MVEPFALRSAAVGIRPRTVAQLLVVADQCATLAGGHQLRPLHREAPEVTPRPDTSTPPERSVGVGAVLDQPQAALGAQRDERIEVGGGAGDVDRDDRLRARRDRGPGRLDVDAQRVGVDVDQDRRGVDRQRCRGRRDEGHAGHDHLVALADVAGGQRGLDRVRAVGERHAVRRAVIRGELLRERGCLVAVALPPASRVEHAEQTLAFVVVPYRPRRIIGMADRRTAEYRREIDDRAHGDTRRSATCSMRWRWIARISICQSSMTMVSPTLGNRPSSSSTRPEIVV